MILAQHLTHMPDSIERARELLRAATQPVLVLGFGAVIANAAPEALALAAAMPQLRVVSTPRAKGVFPEDHAQYRGVVGFAGHPAATHCLFEHSDLALIVGTRLGELTSDNWDPRWQRLRAIRIDITSQSDNWLATAECSLVGDAQVLLEQLTLPPVALASGTHNISPRSAMDERLPGFDWAPGFQTTPTSGTKLQPIQVMQILNQHYPQNGHLFCGIGNTMAWGIHYLRRTLSNRWHVNLGSGAMGHALPAAIGAALSGASALAILGDAEFLMTGFELHTATELQLNLVVIVLNDEGHGMVRVGAKAHCNGQAPSADFTRPVDIVQASRAMGAFAQHAATEERLLHALEGALTRRGPSVIEVSIDRGLMPPLGERLRALSQSFGATKPGAAA